MNRVVHFEVHGKDMDRMQRFYERVFGWKITDMGPAMGNFRMIDTGKDESGAAWPGINGGMNQRRGELPALGEPVNAFICTITVADIDAVIASVLAEGGSMALEKMEIPGGMGTLAYCKDPEGNIFGVLQAGGKE